MCRRAHRVPRSGQGVFVGLFAIGGRAGNALHESLRALCNHKTQSSFAGGMMKVVFVVLCTAAEAAVTQTITLYPRTLQPDQFAILCDTTRNTGEGS